MIDDLKTVKMAIRLLDSAIEGKEPHSSVSRTVMGDARAIIDTLIESQGWRPIESAPKGKILLVYYKNETGKNRTHLGIFIERYTEETHGDWCEYCEERDTYYVPEGWYEVVWNWDEFFQVSMLIVPTHWMPLPQPPVEKGRDDAK